MRRLRLRHRGDDGAVAVLVAVLLSGGVLLGMAALVIDVGGLYAKREQLQAGADAAAWAVAQNCADDGEACTTAEQQAVADRLVAAQIYGPSPGNNVSAAVAAQVCVDGIDCPVWNTAVECRSLRLAYGHWAEVRAYYYDAGSTVMPAPLAGVFTGDPDKGSQVGACSRVSWGAALSLPLTAFAVNTACLAGGVDYYGVAAGGELPDGGLVVPRELPAYPGDDPVLLPEGDGSADACDFVRLTGVDCGVEPTPEATMAAATAPDSACEDAVAEAADAGKPLLVGIYEAGDPGQPRVVGYAAFAPTAAGLNPLTGYFTRVLVLRNAPLFTGGEQSVLDGNAEGVTVIGRTG